MSTSGGSQSQTGSQSGNYSGDQSGLNLSQSSTTANVPDYVKANYDRASGAIGSNGLNGAQSSAMGSAGGGKGGGQGTGMAGMQGAGTGATQPYINSMSGLQPQYQNAANQNYTPWQATQAQTSQAAGPGGVTAQSGAQNMGNYMSPYMNNVVNSSLAGYDNNTANTMNQMRASRDASSAFGDRSAVADSVYKAQSDLGRGQMAANLMNTGFNTAAGYGQADASRNLQADQGNQSTAANMAQFNAGQANNMSQFNAGQSNQANQSNVGNNFTQQGLRLNALNGAGNNAATASGLAQNGVNINQGLSNSLFNMGTTGQGQLLNLVNAGSPFIGQTTNNAGLTANSASGASAGNNSSRGNSKSMGASL